MKKIVFINSMGPGGAERVVSRLLEELGKDGGVQLWTLSEEKFYKVPPSVEQVNLKKLSWVTKLRLLMSLSRDDIVQAHLNRSIFWAGVAKLLGAQYRFQVVHCFAYSPFYQRKGFLGAVHRIFLRRVFSSVDLHIFKAKQMVLDFESVFEGRPKQYRVIYNPYDIERIARLAKCSQVGSIVPGRTNIGVVGRLSKSKRIRDVLAIAKCLSGTAHFHIFGDGDERHEIDRCVVALGSDNVTLHGVVENPFSYIRAMGFYLSCSEAEGFPNALVEALICGAICVHSDCLTGPREILSDEEGFDEIPPGAFSVAERGILFPVSDVAAACKALTFAISSRELLMSKLKPNIRRFLEGVRIEKIASDYADTLR